ncbi:transposable element Tcb2 transposase [Trichonephila clavipes]|nr:transposable element Tcb2 transposase [Trichonephila clavipes]
MGGTLNSRRAASPLVRLVESGREECIVDIENPVKHQIYDIAAAGKRGCKNETKDDRRESLSACQHRHWTVDEWQHVALSDEPRFQFNRADGRVRVWRQPHESTDPTCPERTVQADGGSVMVWGVCNWHDMGPLIRLDTILTGTKEKVSNHGSIPITIDCNVVAFIVFEEGFHQPIKRTKQSVFLDVTVFRHTLVD